jgi:type IV pilus assembly protein PilM
MALSLLRKNSQNGTVGLDIDGRYVAGVLASGGRIASAASADLPHGLVADGEVVDPAGLGAALKSFAGAAGIPRNVRLGVANQQIVVRLIELPPIEDPRERDAAVRFQAAEAIAMPLDEAVLDYQVVGHGENAEGARRMRVVVVAARRSMIEGLVEAARVGGLRPEGIDLDAFALVRMLAQGNGNGAEDRARIYCHLGGVTVLAIAAGTTCLFYRPLSTTWNGEQSVDTLGDEIRLSIDYYMAQPNALRASELVLSGPHSEDEDLVHGLGVALGLETVVAPPLGALDSSALPPNEDARRYTVAAGLALGAAA